MLQQFIMPPTFLLVELSDNCIGQLVFLFNYGYVRSKLCSERHGLMGKSSFYSGTKDGTPWVYVDDMCESVRNSLHARTFS